MASQVTETSAAGSPSALAHFEAKLGLETDGWDAHASLAAGATDFVLLDVRSPALYAQGHAPGALNLPHGKIIGSRMAGWPRETLFVVYCAGPHCNGADKAAARLARLGRPVKLMVGGMTGWVDEGFEVATGQEPGSVRKAA